jgi:pimeloyl-ACP methyl ester carboxylesterase
MVLGRWITPAIRELHLKILSMVPPSTMHARILAVADCDAREALGRVRVPILCLVARHDRLILRSAARAIAKYASRVVLLDAPHCLLQCVPNAAGRQIKAFMQELS